MMLRALIARGKDALDHGGIPNAARDARLLAAHVCELDPSRVTLHEWDDIPDETIGSYDRAISERLQHRPVSRIIGARQFWGRLFQITPDVLDPRGDTETLVAHALQYPSKHILDLGTGSGILGITLAAEQPNAVVVATDISEPALAVAQNNAQIHQVKDRIRFVQADWFNGISGEFDLIISNPPYIAENELNGLARDVMDFDPMIALTPGGDGLAPYRIIAKQARTYLCKTGRVIVEIGYLQGSDVTQMFVDAGFANVQILRDLEGKDRAISAENPI